MWPPSKYKLIECPRDAMQGIKKFIPTQTKIDYINLLLQVGFNTIDFGSFVSPKAIPQMADTKEVLAGLQMGKSGTRLLTIVANLRGAEEACQYDEITFLGFPFSLSETFQRRNTNSGTTDSLKTVEQIFALCYKAEKQAVIYLSMGFGNPYGEIWNYEIVDYWTETLVARGAKIISLADTLGTSTTVQITTILPKLLAKFEKTEIGVHLHTASSTSTEKIKAIYNSGCLRIDSALKGFGGCPMADDRLIGNVATENVIKFLEEKGERLHLNLNYWQEAMNFSEKVFV